jgi:2-keto-4-pentenoate hydratase/2-oxohepta-3-ene-1,7-dioic acid hydratase in catechol pathway
MKAVRFVDPAGESRIGAMAEDGKIRDAGPAGGRGFVPTEEAWQALAAAAGPTYDCSDVKLQHPVVPRKILAIGLNYRSHAEESELQVPSVPVVFAKLPSALIGDGEEIVVPREETRPDYEGELAVVIGRRTYRATGWQAREAIGGISAINDVSGRRAQLETPLRQFTLGKSFDTFAPLGPCIASPDGLDLAALDVGTTVSGEVMQNANTRDLIFSVEDLIAYLSAGITLEPGDVIATGTPGGVGDSRQPPRYLREGDVVEVHVSGVGTLTNRVRMER